MIRKLLLGAAAVLLFFSCATGNGQGAAAAVDSPERNIDDIPEADSSAGITVSNPVLGFSLAFPAGWNFQSDREKMMPEFQAAYDQILGGGLIPVGFAIGGQGRFGFRIIGEPWEVYDENYFDLIKEGWSQAGTILAEHKEDAGDGQNYFFGSYQDEESGFVFMESILHHRGNFLRFTGWSDAESFGDMADELSSILSSLELE